MRFKTLPLHLILSLSALSICSLSGCASPATDSSSDSTNGAPKNKLDETNEAKIARTKLSEEWTGRVGYLMAPPTFKTSTAFHSADPDQFRRCDKVRITKILYSYTENEYTIFLEQNKQTFAIVGLTRSTQDDNSNHKDLWNLTDFFSDQLPIFQPATVKTTTGTVATKDLACDGKFWKEMSPKEFTFVMGPPTSVVKSTENKRSVEEWNYRVSSPGISATYWFENQRLRNWRR